jgi:long-chain acyl-CoA synthetase
MKSYINSFAALYADLKKLPENETFLNHIESGQWKTYSKTEFITTVRYLTLAFDAEGWRGKQVAMAIAPSTYWLMIDYGLMLSGAVSVPLFTNISTKNLQFQIHDADLHTVFIQTDEQERIILEADSTIRCIDIDTTDPKRKSLDTFIKLVKRSTKNYLQNSTRYSPE